MADRLGRFFGTGCSRDMALIQVGTGRFLGNRAFIRDGALIKDRLGRFFGTGRDAQETWCLFGTGRFLGNSVYSGRALIRDGLGCLFATER